MNPVYRFFRSVRLAVVLLLAITVLSMLSTLVPQGQPADWYRGAYPEGLAGLILLIGFHRFFSSVLFLAPAALFVANLGTCTVWRLTTRARSGAPRRHGPDLVHIALLVLILGGITTTLVQRQRYFTMGVGDVVEISGGYRLELLDFQVLTYESGRPRDWVSRVRVQQGDRTLQEGYGIEVNHPLRLGLLRVYQTSFDTDGVVTLADSVGGTQTMARGDGIPVGTDTVRYLVAFEATGPNDFTAVFQDYRGEHPQETSRAAPGDTVGAYQIESIQARELTGLTASRDPGYIPVLIALLLGALGMTLTFVQRKKGDPTT